MTTVLLLVLALSSPQRGSQAPPSGSTTPTQQPPATTAQSPSAPTATSTKMPAATEGLRTQVMLDRAGFSPGVIDGQAGASTRKALEVYRKQSGAAATQQPAIEPLTTYRITEQDAAGPFVERMPRDLVEQSKLPHLGYASLVEALAERFHTTPAFLQRLNKGAKFAAGEEIVVPNVVPLVLPAATEIAKAQKGRGRGDAVGTTGTDVPQNVVVTVSKSSSSLTVTDAASGRVVLYAPVTTGSGRDPLPIGEWKVTGVSYNPPFNYNPDLFWDADPSHAKAKIPPGPNNPVGVVWIDISKEHYGIHGTPEPSTIGRTASHGCVRLTNWDALNVATLVRPGTRVVFTQ